MNQPIDMLLTGATGLLGHYVLAEILRATQWRVRVLVRDDEDLARSRLDRLLSELGFDLRAFAERDRFSLVRGSLPDSIDEAALDGVDTVLHAAGQTTFASTPDGEPRRTNVEGTAALLEVAARRGVRHFVQISTAFVCGDQTGHIFETFSHNPPPFCNDYERSKWEAERLVLGWADGSRIATICRPSILFGDSATGRTTSANGIYLIARATQALARAVESNDAIDRHAMPFRIPGRPGATCNLIPVDHAARRIVAIMADRHLHGRIHHITNPHPPTHGAIKRWLEEYFDIRGGQFCEEQWPLENPNDYEQLFYGFGNAVKDYFRDGLVFETQADATDGSPRPAIRREGFLQSIRYAHRKNWARTTKTPSNKRRTTVNPVVDSEWYFRNHLVDTIPRSCVARIQRLNAVVSYTIDSPTETWTCVFEGGCLSRVARGEHAEEADFGFRIARHAFSELVTGLRSPQQVFLEGQAEITGNVERALRMVPIMAEYIDEFPTSVVEPVRRTRT
jgi:thioester reductase-like protein